MSAIVVVVLALAAMPAPQSVAARYAAAVVVVERATPAGTQKSQGFFLSASGVLCTVLPGARPGDAVVVRGEPDDAAGGTAGDEAAAGVVSVVDDEGLALVQVSVEVHRVHAALGVSSSEQPSTWLVGLSRDKGGVQGALGGVERRGADRWSLLLPLPRGAPILDDDNAVVAIALTSRGGGQIEALPVWRLKALAARLPKS